MYNTIEANGTVGGKSWKKQFANHEEMAAWLEDRGALVSSSRDITPIWALGGRLQIEREEELARLREGGCGHPRCAGQATRRIVDSAGNCCDVCIGHVDFYRGPDDIVKVRKGFLEGRAA